MKQFTNARLYVLKKPLEMELEELNEVLSRRPAREPFAYEVESPAGFVEPFGVEGAFAEPVHRHRKGQLPGSAVLIKVRVTRRHVPAKAVHREVAARVAEIERSELRVVRGREKQNIKAEVLEDMLPQAFLVETDISAFVQQDVIIIDQSSANKAELLLSALREALGSLPAVPLQTNYPASEAMTDWVREGATNWTGLQIGNLVKVERNFEKGQTLSGSRVDLSEEPLRDVLIDSGRVLELGLSLSDENQSSIGFVLTEENVIKGIRWPEEYKDLALAELGHDEDPVSKARVDATLALGGLEDVAWALVGALDGVAFDSAAQNDDEEDLI